MIKTTIIRHKKLTAVISVMFLMVIFGTLHYNLAGALIPYEPGGTGAVAKTAPQSGSGRHNTSIVTDPNSGNPIDPYYVVGNNTGVYSYSNMDINVYVNDKTAANGGDQGATITPSIVNAGTSCSSASGGGVVGPDYSQSGGPIQVTYSIVGSGGVIPGTTRTVTGLGCTPLFLPSVTISPGTSINTTPANSLPHYNAYYLVRVAVTGGGQGENSFSVVLSSSATNANPVVGYLGGPGKFGGFGYRDGDLNDCATGQCNYWNAWMTFGPITDCSELTTPNATKSGTVSWNDLDVGRTDWNPRPAPNMTLYEQKINIDGSVTGNSWNKIEDHNGYGLTDNNDFNTQNFKVGFRYKVVMSNFGTRNTVRLNLDGNIRAIGGNLSEHPSLAKCYSFTCSVTNVVPGTPPPYTAGQSVAVTITVKNTSLVGYGSTWRPGTELLHRSLPSAKNLALTSNVAPGGPPVTFTDNITVQATAKPYTYKMYTDSGATAMSGPQCTKTIGPGSTGCTVNCTQPGGSTGYLEIQSCRDTYVRNASVPATRLVGGIQVPITRIPVAIQIHDDTDGRAWTYLLSNGAPNGGDSGPISTFGMGMGNVMWPHHQYTMQLFMQGGNAPTASPNAGQPLVYPDNGNWNPPNDANQTGYYYGIFPYGQPVTTGTCITAVCSTGSSPDLEPGQSSNFNAGIDFNNETREPFNSDSVNGYNVKIDASGGLFGAPATVPINIPPGPSTVNATFNARLDYTGDYSWSLLLLGTAGPQQDLPGLDNPCDTPPITPATRPFIQVWGGDINTGGGFETANASGAISCPSAYPDYVSPSTRSGDANYGGIKTFGAASGSYGSLSDFGALSLGQIAKNPPYINFGAAPTFANTTSPLGQLNSSSPDYCTLDFYDKTQDSPTTIGAPGDVSSLPALQNLVNGNIDSLGGGTIGSGQKKILYVNGDITINSNIVYGAWDPNNPDTAPSFAVIVKGNINIGPNVTRLDGLYVAQPSSSGQDGVFNTCANNTGNQFCNKQLVANGAVIARIIRPLRSVGTLSPDANPAFSPAPGHNAAEVFNYIPSMLISAPGFAQGHNDLEGLFSLPPVF